MATSTFGTALSAVALPLLALTSLDASALEVSLLTGAGYLGWLILGLPSGVIVQRARIRRLQVGMDLIRAVALLSIAVCWWLGLLTYWQVLATVVVVGFANVIFDVANSTYLPKIVDRETLISRNSLISGTHAIASTGGPSAAGLVVQMFSAAAAIFIDALTYLSSAFLLARLPEASRPVSGEHKSAGHVIRTGLTWVRQHPVMFPCVVWAGVTNLVSGAVAALTPVYLVRDLGVSAVTVGFVFAAEGIGALLGSSLAPRVSGRLGTAKTLVLSSLLSSVSLFALPLTGTPFLIPLFMVGTLGCGAGVVIGSIVTRTHRQTDTPEELLPMVMASVRFFTWGAIPIGAVGAGVLASTSLGTLGTLWTTCIVYLAGPISLLLSPVRSRQNLSDSVEAST